MKTQLNLALQSNLKDIKKQLPEQIEKRMLQSAVELHGHVIRMLAKKGSGRTYRVPATNRTHRASASGEPPATMLGGLRTGYQFKVDGNGYDAQGIVGSPEIYAVYLEKGTRNIRPRPHLRRSYIENYTKIMRFFEGIL